jgi:hypothetical protein
MTSFKFVRTVMGSLVAITLSVGFCTASGAQAPQVVRWEEIRGLSSPIGLDVNNNVVLNTIGTTVPAERPWSTRSGHASIDLMTGRLNFVVQGLTLAGGSGIGTTSPFTQVVGRLVCDTFGSPVLVDTPPVSLSLQGDAAFHDDVSPLPAVCSEQNIAFLLVNPTTARWIAFGAVRTP